jgi:hypothetical protein
MGNIIIPPFAEEDIKNSVSYYQDKGIEKQFLIILDHSFQIISKNPLSFPAIRKEIRKFVSKTFLSASTIFQRMKIYAFSQYSTIKEILKSGKQDINN